MPLYALVAEYTKPIKNQSSTSSPDIFFIASIKETVEYIDGNSSNQAYENKILIAHLISIARFRDYGQFKATVDELNGNSGIIKDGEPSLSLEKLLGKARKRNRRLVVYDNYKYPNPSSNKQQ